MDVLSDVMTTLRIGRPDGAKVEWLAPWGARFADEPGTAGFLLVLRGSAWMRLGDDDPVALGPGDVVFSPNGAGYALMDSPDTPIDDTPLRPGLPEDDTGPSAGGNPTAVTLCGGYRLDPDRTHPLLRELPGTIHVPAHLGRHPRLRAAADVLGDEIDGARLGAAAILPLALDMLLLYVLRAWFEDGPTDGESATGWARALADPGISTSLGAVHTDPAHPWTVQTLADRARMSRATFARRFTTLVGQSPLAYLTWWRMTLATGLLRDTDDPLARIASRVGYGSEFAFANAFKRHHGLSPGRFRRRSVGAPSGAEPVRSGG